MTVDGRSVPRIVGAVAAAAAALVPIAAWPAPVQQRPTITAPAPSFAKGIAPQTLTTPPLRYQADGTIMNNGQNLASAAAGIPFKNGIQPMTVQTPGLAYRASGQILQNGVPIGGASPYAKGIQPQTITTPALAYRSTGKIIASSTGQPVN